jgi:hypothetical protein
LEYQAEAERLLAAFTAEIERIGREGIDGKPLSVDLGNVLGTFQEVAENLVRNHDLEARRGFDVLAALRRMPGHVRDAVRNGRAVHAAPVQTR